MSAVTTIAEIQRPLASTGPENRIMHIIDGEPESEPMWVPILCGGGIAFPGSLPTDVPLEDCCVECAEVHKRGPAPEPTPVAAGQQWKRKSDGRIVEVVAADPPTMYRRHVTVLGARRSTMLSTRFFATHALVSG